MNVTVIGCGYVGLTTGVALAYIGHQVIGVEKNPEKLELLRQKQSPIHEAGMDEMLDSIETRISFTNNTQEAAEDADLILIAVGTPPKENGDADTSYVETAAAEIASVLKDKHHYTIIVKSTVPIGANHKVANVIQRVLATRKIKAQVYFASNPEFLREGKALTDMLYPDRIVVGAEQEEAIESIRRLYRPILEQTFTPPKSLKRPQNYFLPPLVTTNTTSAEMTKYAANAFLALKISYINEIAGLCEKVGADVNEVARGIGLDPRIGARFLHSGIGWGGSCFPKDTLALLALGENYNYGMPIIQAAQTVNNRQRRLVIEKLQANLKVLRGKTIGILGLTFKADTDDVREAPSLDIIKMLIASGAIVKAHDPIAIDNAKELLAGEEIEFVADPYEMARDCDALVLLTEWNCFSHLDFEKLYQQVKTPFFLDGRNFLNPEQLRKAGFVYEGFGR